MINTKFEALSAAQIKKHLPEELKKAPVQVFQTIDSTSSHAKALALQGAPCGVVVLSEEQTAGRGRRGKSFFSPQGSGLYMSLILRSRPLFCDEQLITVAAAAAVCRALEGLEITGARIKWVNDIYLNGRKLCGILCEKAASENGDTAVIVGIGVNCAPSAFPPELRDIACSLNMPISRNELAAKIITELDKMLSMDTAAIIDQYRARSLMSGRCVRFNINGNKLEATAVGIADNGNLLVTLDNGEGLSLSSGEVSVEGTGEWR